MWLSRGWYGLILFWVAVVAFCGIGAGILQTLGSSVQQPATAIESRPDPVLVEFAGVVPLTPIAVATTADAATEVPAEPEEASKIQEAKTEVVSRTNAEDVSPEPVPVPTADTTAISDRDSFTPDAPDTALEQVMAAPHKVLALADEGARPEALHSGRKFQLRIVRDSERCPKVVCYKWNLIQQRLKRPGPAMVDLAGLRLAPGLREAAEQGNVELIIEAVEQHKTIKGRDSVIFVATNLAGVMPHDRPQDFVPPL